MKLFTIFPLTIILGDNSLITYISVSIICKLKETFLSMFQVFKVDIESCDEDSDLKEKCNRSYVFVMEEFSGPVFDYLKQHGQR